MRIYNKIRLKPLQRSLRKNATDAERKIWSFVRNRQIEGLKFFRQYGVGDYILDFYCPETKLAIEIDGGQHDEAQQKAHDGIRTQYLNSLNIRVLRFWNNEILGNTEGVYEEILKHLRELLPPSSLNKEEERNPLNNLQNFSIIN